MLLAVSDLCFCVPVACLSLCSLFAQRIADDLSGAANDSTKATDRLLWAVNAFGESLAEVGSTGSWQAGWVHSFVTCCQAVCVVVSVHSDLEVVKAFLKLQDTFNMLAASCTHVAAGPQRLEPII